MYIYQYQIYIIYDLIELNRYKNTLATTVLLFYNLHFLLQIRNKPSIIDK